ncbi:MAG: HNH endonuclease signature motif containing protein, partial [Ruminococcus sp.]
YKHCIITGITNTKLLIASHIKPWSVSNNYERLSENNGLLLSPTYDKLFDLGLITFDKKSKIKISGLLGKQDKEILNIDTKKEYDLKLNKEGILNMEYHNDVIFIN